jgi:N-acetylneuraminate synthase
MKNIFQKSIVASKNLLKGEIIKLEDIKFKKPGTGISSSKYKDVIGKKLLKDIYEDDLLSFESLI